LESGNSGMQMINTILYCQIVVIFFASLYFYLFIYLFFINRQNDAIYIHEMQYLYIWNKLNKVEKNKDDTCDMIWAKRFIRGNFSL